MAHSQNSSDEIEETTKLSHDEVVVSEDHGISSISTGIDVNPDVFYVELLNKNSNDSEIVSFSETNQNIGVIENVTNDGLVKDSICINESCSNESDTKLEALVKNQCDNVSSDSTSKNTSVEEQVTENDLPMKIADQMATAVRQCQDSDSWTEDSSSSSSSDSDFFEEMRNSISPKTVAIKSQGELDLEDLPPIEDLQISVEEKELMKVGSIHAIVTKQVVILALKDQKPLDLDSVLFLSHDKPLGRIFDVFGPVAEPFYIVRFNSPQDIINKGINISADVYFAPQKSDMTSFVFVEVLRLQKGSDASWKDNNEPPEEFLDYSDDEQEKMAKQKRRGKNRSRQDADVQYISSKKLPKVDMTRDAFSNSKGKKSQLQEHSFQPHSSKNPFRRSFYPTSFDRKITVPNKCSSSQSSAHPPTLDEVPIWITSPPPFLQSTLTTSQPNMSNSFTPISMHYQPQSLLQHNPQQNQNPQLVSSYSPMQQIRPGQLVLFPKQPFIPRQPQNHNQSMIRQTQFRFPVQERYIHPPQPLVHQQQVQQSLIPQTPVLQNLNQPHIHRPVFSVTPMTPVAFSSQSPFIPTNCQTFAASALSVSVNQPFQWQHQEQARSPFTVQSPPPTVQFNTQVPSFPSLPPLIRFNAAQNCSIPPPQPPPSPLSQQFLPNHSRF